MQALALVLELPLQLELQATAIMCQPSTCRHAACHIPTVLALATAHRAQVVPPLTVPTVSPCTQHDLPNPSFSSDDDDLLTAAETS